MGGVKTGGWRPAPLLASEGAGLQTMQDYAEQADLEIMEFMSKTTITVERMIYEYKRRSEEKDPSTDRWSWTCTHTTCVWVRDRRHGTHGLLPTYMFNVYYTPRSYQVCIMSDS